MYAQKKIKKNEIKSSISMMIKRRSRFKSKMSVVKNDLLMQMAFIRNYILQLILKRCISPIIIIEQHNYFEKNGEENCTKFHGMRKRNKYLREKRERRTDFRELYAI